MVLLHNRKIFTFKDKDKIAKQKKLYVNMLRTFLRYGTRPSIHLLRLSGFGGPESKVIGAMPFTLTKDIGAMLKVLKKIQNVERTDDPQHDAQILAQTLNMPTQTLVLISGYLYERKLKAILLAILQKYIEKSLRAEQKKIYK